MRVLLSLRSLFPRSCILPLLAALCLGAPTLAQQTPPTSLAKQFKPRRPAFEPKSLMGVSNARPVNVAQLEEALRESHGHSDRQVAKQLASLGLTRRFSLARLQQWQMLLPGKRSRRALNLLADAATFLPLPDTDEPALPRPTHADQEQMVTRAVKYLGYDLRHLPDFFATRITEQYEEVDSKIRDSPDALAWRHLITRRAIVHYVDGQEEATSQKQQGTLPRNAAQLDVQGTFGPILILVVRDAAHGIIEWSHWEQGQNAPLAVFRYRIAKAQSHFGVTFQTLNVHAGRLTLQQQLVAYHGEIAVDPASGAILRLTLEADPEPSVPIARSDIAIDYALTGIGGRDYICPVRSVVIARGPAIATGPSGQIEGYGDQVTTLNQITFTNYHVFRSDSRILTGNPPAGKPQP
jgi:hypothetical protein